LTVSVFIDGAAGTTGLEIRERLTSRQDLQLITLGEEQRKDPRARAEALNDADFVILCLPDDAAREAVGLIRGDTRVIDASSAHRTSAGWTYGFPELGFDVANAVRVSNPGCYPTGFLALVAPLTKAGLVPADWPLTVHAASGYSGGGKAMVAEYQAGASAFRTYALSLRHKHLPEMTVHAGLVHPPIFAPAVANTYRGMVVEVPLHLHAMPGAPSHAAISDALAKTFENHPLVTVAPSTQAVAIEENAGTDRLTLRVCADGDTGTARLVATLDNLGKGAGGAAVQNLNLMAGLDPLAGLILEAR
jgi:N-acetyl-gamma-glutamyl-phosphate reductase